MTEADNFDMVYAATSRRLVGQVFAMTGDLGEAGRSAARPRRPANPAPARSTASPSPQSVQSVQSPGSARLTAGADGGDRQLTVARPRSRRSATRA